MSHDDPALHIQGSALCTCWVLERVGLRSCVGGLGNDCCQVIKGDLVEMSAAAVVFERGQWAGEYGGGDGTAECLF